MTTMLVRVIATISLIVMVPASTPARQRNDDVILQFQRAADAYAFRHRQTDRRGTAPAPLVEGTFFTPTVAAALRDRLRASGCERAAAGQEFVVPSVNGSTEGTGPLPSCMSAALPTLPAELEYRVAGVALLLADAHLHIVVDILHGAFPRTDN